MNEQEFARTEAALLHRLNDPATSLTDLEDLIEPIDSLKAQILEVANSALFGSHRRVTSLKQAMLLIGFRNIRRILVERENKRKKAVTPEKTKGAEI